MPGEKIVMSINASWNIFNFRKDLIGAFQHAGYRVTALAPEDEYSQRLTEWGVDFRPIRIDQKGMSPLRDLRLLRDYRSALRALRPDVFLGYTIKPNIYGSLAAQSLGIPVINNVSGLGTAFLGSGLLTRVASALYRAAFKRSSTVFFQNKDDRALFLQKHLVAPRQARLLPGSGVDLPFSPHPMPPARPVRSASSSSAACYGTRASASSSMRRDWCAASFLKPGSHCSVSSTRQTALRSAARSWTPGSAKGLSNIWARATTSGHISCVPIVSSCHPTARDCRARCLRAPRWRSR